MEKRVSESRTEQVQILSQGSLNGYKRLFGGKLMEWIERCRSSNGKTSFRKKCDDGGCRLA